MKNVRRSWAVFVLLFSVTISCTDKQLEPVKVGREDESMADALTIEMARQWFDSKVAGKAGAKVSTTKTPLWEHALQSTDKDGVSVVIAPVAVDEADQTFGLIAPQNNGSAKITDSDMKAYRNDHFSTPQKLVMIRDSKGKVQTLLMKVVANQDYFEKSLRKAKKEHGKNLGKSFTGAVFFYDWDEVGIMEGFYYDNSKFQGSFEPKNITKNAKKIGCTSYEYTENVPCGGNNARFNACTVTYTMTSCDGGSITSPSISSMPMFFADGGGVYADAISSSYRQNTVDSFLANASRYGVTFNPDERLDFIDNFALFLQVQGNLIDAIRQWGNRAITWIENLLRGQVKSIKNQERTLLANNGPFASYRVNLMLYVWNAGRAGNIAEAIMNSIGRDGSEGRTCGECRGNAVKHAAWVAFNCGIFGRGLASNLADAHERLNTGASGDDGEPSGSRRDMDNNNNGIGLIMYDLYTDFEAVAHYGDVLNNGLPNNPAMGFKFIQPVSNVDTNTLPLKDTKDYPNSN